MKNNREYLKWSGIAMQGVVAILALLFIGKHLDERQNNKVPYFMLSGILIGTLYFFYSLIKASNKK